MGGGGDGDGGDDGDGHGGDDNSLTLDERIGGLTYTRLVLLPNSSGKHDGSIFVHRGLAAATAGATIG